MEQKQHTKTLFVLIGPPGVGKTTWTSTNAEKAMVVNRDSIVESVAAEHGLTYDEAYIAPPEGVAEGDHVPTRERFGKVVPSDLEWRPFDFERQRSIHRRVQEELNKTLLMYANGPHDVVLDMTSLKRSDREMYMQHFGMDFRKVAVLFDFQTEKDISTIKERCRARQEELLKQGRSKSISDAVIDRMVDSYEPPSASEGFDEIVASDILSIMKNNPKWNPL